MLCISQQFSVKLVECVTGGIWDQASHLGQRFTSLVSPDFPLKHTQRHERDENAHHYQKGELSQPTDQI